MFCSKCGKEIMNEAVICPSCGCPTNNFTQNTNDCSNDYIAIQEFARKAKNIRTLGILAAIFCFGIGIIFSIIIWVQSKTIVAPEISTTNPKELVEFEIAKRYLKIGDILSTIPIIALGICLCVFAISFSMSIY